MNPSGHTPGPCGDMCLAFLETAWLLQMRCIARRKRAGPAPSVSAEHGWLFLLQSLVWTSSVSRIFLLCELIHRLWISLVEVWPWLSLPSFFEIGFSVHWTWSLLIGRSVSPGQVLMPLPPQNWPIHCSTTLCFWCDPMFVSQVLSIPSPQLLCFYWSQRVSCLWLKLLIIDKDLFHSQEYSLSYKANCPCVLIFVYCF